MNKECHKVPCRFRLNPYVLWRFSRWRGAYPETSGNFAHKQKLSQHLSKAKGQKCCYDISLLCIKIFCLFLEKNRKQLSLRISITICQKYSIFVWKVIRSHWHWLIYYLHVDPVPYLAPLYDNHCSLQQNSWQNSRTLYNVLCRFGQG